MYNVLSCAKSMDSVIQTGTDVFVVYLNMPHLCPFIAGVSSFRYEINISRQLVGVCVL